MFDPWVGKIPWRRRWRATARGVTESGVAERPSTRAHTCLYVAPVSPGRAEPTVQGGWPRAAAAGVAVGAPPVPRCGDDPGTQGVHCCCGAGEPPLHPRRGTPHPRSPLPMRPAGGAGAAHSTPRPRRVHACTHTEGEGSRGEEGLGPVWKRGGLTGRTRGRDLSSPPCGRAPLGTLALPPPPLHRLRDAMPSGAAQPTAGCPELVGSWFPIPGWNPLQRERGVSVPGPRGSPALVYLASFPAGLLLVFGFRSFLSPSLCWACFPAAGPPCLRVPVPSAQGGLFRAPPPSHSTSRPLPPLSVVISAAAFVQRE